MGQGGGRQFFAAQHAGDFFDAVLGFEYLNFTNGLLALAVFFHLPMVFTASGYLGQMSNGQHLMLFAQRPQRTPHHFCYATADARIYFVKNQGWYVCVLTGNHL